MANASSSYFWWNLSEYRTGIMGFSAIMIILFLQHFISVFPFSIFHKCGYWGVDIFLFLSGIGLVRSFQINTLSTFYRRRFLRLIPACVIFGLLKCLFQVIVDEGETLSQISIMRLASINLWFIRAIICYYIISPLLIISIRKNPMVTICLIAVVYIINGLFFKVHDASSFTWVVERLFVFSLGIYFAVKQEYLNNKVLSASIIVFCIAVVTVMIEGRPFDNRPYNTILMFAVATGTLGSCQMCIDAFKLLPNACLRFCMLFGKYSLELYLVHEFIFHYLKMYCSEQYYPFALILGISLALAVSHVCHSALSSFLSHPR